MVERGDRKTDRLTDRARERNRERDRDGGGGRDRQTDRKKKRALERNQGVVLSKQKINCVVHFLVSLSEFFFFFKKKINGAKSCST